MRTSIVFRLRGNRDIVTGLIVGGTIALFGWLLGW